MEQDLFTTVGLNSWQDFKNYIDQFSENWAFRGQASANWILNNAIERTAFIDLYQDIEADFVAEFQRGARAFVVGGGMVLAGDSNGSGPAGFDPQIIGFIGVNSESFCWSPESVAIIQAHTRFIL